MTSSTDEPPSASSDDPDASSPLPADVDDNILLACAQGADVLLARTAARLLWLRYRKQIFDYVRRKLKRQPADVEDIVGEVARKFWQRLQNGNEPLLVRGSAVRYFITIARNEIHTHHRTQRHRVRSVSLNDLLAAGYEPNSLHGHELSRERDEVFLRFALAVLSSNARRSPRLAELLGALPAELDEESASVATWLDQWGFSVLMRALRSIHETSRDALILQFFFGLSEEEAGTILHISRSAVGTRVSIGRQRLRDVYASVLFDAGFSLGQIVQVMRRLRCLSPSDGSAATEIQARISVLQFIESGVKLQAKGLDTP